MAEEKDITYEDSDIEALDTRLRKVELAGASTESTITGVSRDIAEIKVFMQKWLQDSSRISEIATKVEAIPRLEQQMNAALSKYDDLYKRFIILEHSHGQCTTDRTIEKSQLAELLTRMGKVEGERLTMLEQNMRDIQGSRKQVTSVIGGWAEKLIFMVMLYLIYLIVIHFTKDNAPGDMLNNPPKLKSGTYQEFVIPNNKITLSERINVQKS